MKERQSNQGLSLFYHTLFLYFNYLLLFKTIAVRAGI